VKASHQIDLAYLYYLPFCAVFSSRDNFHVQVAPLFMHPAQQFVHGDDLKADLKRLHERYSELPLETREKGLYTFAQFPPDDSSFLTTRLWDTYLPDWRKDSKNVVEVPEEIKEALAELMRKYQGAAPAADAEAVGTEDLAFAQVTRRIKPLKGDYFRIAKDVALKANEEEDKASTSILPRGTASATLAEKLARLTADSKCSNIELFLLRRKFDENDQPIVRDGVGAAGIEEFQIHCFDDETRTQLEQHVEARGVLSVLMLWTRYGTGKLGIERLKPAPDGKDNPAAHEFEEWEGKVIAEYLHRHDL
jgi:hypothetical protein